MDLSQRLDRIITAKPKRPKEDVKPLEESISGEWIESDSGKVFLREEVHRIAQDFDLGGLGKVMDLNTGLERLLFLDTETTGLAGGTGTVAFMVGLGYFENNQFITAQLFIPGFQHELLMLEKLQTYIDRFDHVVTFNGRCFDIPLLETRYLMQRLRPRLLKLTNIDLLHHSRTIWKKKLESCSLQSLEASVLRHYREDDTPGELIPQIYFNYLRTGETHEIKGIFIHNEQDVVSMAKLLKIIASVFSNPDSPHFDDPIQQLSVGRYMVNKGFETDGLAYLERAATDGAPHVRDEAYVFLGRLCKRQNDFENAMAHWGKISSNPRHVLYSLTEQAKFLEHKRCDYKAALDVTTKAIKFLRECSLLDFPVEIDEKNLHHRQNRLINKLNANKKSRS